MSQDSDSQLQDGVRTAVKHALVWLVLGNGVGLYLSLLLLKPGWQLAEWTYGRWVPVHLNVQLYGWTALPLVAWLFVMYEVERSRIARWAPAAVWAWTTALAMGLLRWLNGQTSGKIFLAWKERAKRWGKLRQRISLAGLIGLALVPGAIILTASPSTYPPVDQTTGGPTGSSLLGSSLIVVGLMLLLPRAIAVGGKGKAGWGTWAFFIFCGLFFGVAEVIGGTHFDGWQNGSLLLMPPWAWLLARDWSGFTWTVGSRGWRVAMFGWWWLLVLTGYLMYFPWVLDRIKFTQGLVAHSHLAMAGFTTSFCALLIVILTGSRLGGVISISLWHLAVGVMLLSLASMGWQEGADFSWMLANPAWRDLGLAIRSACGVVMLSVSVVWLIQWNTRCTR